VNGNIVGATYGHKRYDTLDHTYPSLTAAVSFFFIIFGSSWHPEESQEEGKKKRAKKNQADFLSRQEEKQTNKNKNDP
jgi:hypothetical protein